MLMARGACWGGKFQAPGWMNTTLNGRPSRVSRGALRGEVTSALGLAGNGALGSLLPRAAPACALSPLCPGGRPERNRVRTAAAPAEGGPSEPVQSACSYVVTRRTEHGGRSAATRGRTGRREKGRGARATAEACRVKALRAQDSRRAPWTASDAREKAPRLPRWAV